MRDLLSNVPERILTAGVFRRQPIDDVLATARAAGVNAVQLHGGEPVAELDRLRDAGFRHDPCALDRREPFSAHGKT